MRTLMELIEQFATDDDCREHIEYIRWPNGVIPCPKCKENDGKVWRRANGLYICPKCDHRWSVMVGTIMEDSHLPLRKWFLAIHLMCQSKKGISANQLKRELGITYKTAWFLCHRIREAMKHDDFEKLCGIIEIDDCYIASPNKRVPKGKRKRGRGTDKGPAIAIKERGPDGKIRSAAVMRLDGQTITDFVAPNAGEVTEFHTDEFKGYLSLKQFPVPHKTVDHGIWYVDGDVHCNGVETHWSLLVRGVIGTFHKVSIKHLGRYLTEFDFRANHRKDASIFERVLSGGEGKLLRYKKLVNDGGQNE